MIMLNRGIRLAIGMWALAFAGTAGAQENLDLGKSGAQLYASDCAICHKSAQGLNRAGGLFGLQSFLREHYTVSRESAAVIAAYLKSVDRAAPAAPARGRTTKRSAKGEERGRAGESKPGEKKPEAGKAGAGKPARAKVTEPKSEAAKPAEKPSEPKSSDAKAAEPKPAKPQASEPKPSEGAKPEKSE